MPRQIGPTVEILMQRVRQTGGLAVDPDFATEIYSYCEQIINAHTKRVITSTTLTTPKEKLLFHFRTEISDALEIVTIRESGRRIEKFTTLDQISAYDIDWFRNITGTRFEAWIQLSRDLLILYPGQAAISSVDIEYVRKLTQYTNFAASYNTDSELPGEDIEMVIELAEIVLLTRFRQIKEAQDKMKIFIPKYRIGK